MMKWVALDFFVLSLFLLTTISCSAQQSVSPEGEITAMTITSPAFKNNQAIPSKHSCEEVDLSPPLMISGVPVEAKSLALIMDDPDAPAGTWVHWVVYNISPDTTVIKQNSKPGKDGKNDFGRNGYAGPCPPLGQHRYFFKLYALDTMLTISGDVTKKDLETAMTGHIIAQAELVGVYRKMFE